MEHKIEKKEVSLSFMEGLSWGRMNKVDHEVYKKKFSEVEY